MFAGLTGWHLLIIVAVLVLIFGATRLPALSRGIGQSIRILRHDVRSADDDALAHNVDNDHERS